MKYYRELKSNRIECLLCRHYCKLKSEQIGICKVNQNSNQSLKNLVYNHPSTIAVDPIEKKPLYHFLPSTKSLSIGTLGCNFKCPFCQNWEISQAKFKPSDKITKEQIVALALKYEAKSISYTYNEPTVFYPFAKDIGEFAKEYGLKNIFVSNGFESKEIIEDMQSWVDGVNIDLKSFKKDYYKKSLKGDLEGVKESLELFAKSDIWLEVTTLIIDKINSDRDELKEMAKFIVNSLGVDTPWHLSAFHPDYKMREHNLTKLKSITDAYEIAVETGINYTYLGNVPTPNQTICPNCETMLIKRDKFRVEKLELKDGKCPKCSEKIAGVWSV